MTIKYQESLPAGSVAEVAEDGTFPVTLIAPGQGSTAFYTEEVIAEYAPTAWPKGTHVYLDHLKEGETRTPEKLLGALVEDTKIDPETGEARNRFKPLSKHRDWIEEVRPYVGLSISASGEGRRETIDGRETVFAESIDYSITNTVDIVSYAGRAGRFLESFLEEANESDPLKRGLEKGNGTMAVEDKLDQLTSTVASLVGKFEARESAELEAKQAQEAAEKAVVDAEQVEKDAAEDRNKAIEATKAVAESDAPASLKEELYAGIAEGKYDITESLEKHKKLREEWLAEAGAFNFREAGASAANAAEVTSDIPNGW